MERIFNFELMDFEPEEPREGQYIFLQNGHLIIEASLADSTIGNTRQVYAVYYPNLNAVLMAPDTDQTFKQAHEVVMLFVKIKNAKGDRSISIQEFMADHPIKEEERMLKFMSAPGMSMLHITL